MKKDNLILNFIGGFLVGLTAADVVVDFKRSKIPAPAKLLLTGAVYAGDAIITTKAGQVAEKLADLNAISDQMDEACDHIETEDE